MKTNSELWKVDVVARELSRPLLALALHLVHLLRKQLSLMLISLGLTCCHVLLSLHSPLILAFHCFDAHSSASRASVMAQKIIKLGAFPRHRRLKCFNCASGCSTIAPTSSFPSAQLDKSRSLVQKHNISSEHLTLRIHSFRITSKRVLLVIVVADHVGHFEHFTAALFPSPFPFPL